MLKVLDGSAGYGKPLTEQEIKDFLTNPDSKYIFRDHR
jgi:hypothetical protein